MSKVVISIGYRSYVMDAKDALAVAEAMASAERYDTKYVKDGDSMHHIWQQDGSEDNTTMKLISNEMYRMAKLAGKPKES
jgi:hypothetical protein